MQPTDRLPVADEHRRLWKFRLAAFASNPKYVTPVILLVGVSSICWIHQGIEHSADEAEESSQIHGFVEYCDARRDGAEGNSQIVSGFTLLSAGVLFNHGDSSAILDWPGADVEAQWSCNPKPLPRHWSRNEEVNFWVSGADGSRVERSFAPDLMASELGNYRCALGQLTPEGFRQMATLGRHLAYSYANLVGPRLSVRSADTKRSLASTVGVLITLLGSDSGREHYSPESDVNIVADVEAPNLDLAGDRDAQGQPKSGSILNILLGNHLLTRWCHSVDLPCRQAWAGRECWAIHDAVTYLKAADRRYCEVVLVAKSHVKEAVRLFEAIGANNSKGVDLALVSIDSLALPSILRALFGEDACLERDMVRPPFGSRLAVERWQRDSDKAIFWRILWNGVDVTSKVNGCSSDFPPGCEDATISRLLKALRSSAGWARI